MRTKSVCLALVAALLLAAPAAGEDAPATKKIANPEYANWSGFAVGAFVELTMVSDAMGQRSTMKTTHRLVELTAEKAVVESATVIEGMPAEAAAPATRRDVPAEIEVPEGTAPGSVPGATVKEGEETVDVVGTAVKCKTIETTMENGGMTTRSKVWISPQVPGGTAKMEVRTEGKMGDQTFVSTMTTTVTKWAGK